MKQGHQYPKSRVLQGKAWKKRLRKLDDAIVGIRDGGRAEALTFHAVPLMSKPSPHWSLS